MKFKVGDKVKYKDECINGCNIHNVFVVEQTNSYDYCYLVSDINDSSKKYLIAEEDLELINESTLKYNTLKYNTLKYNKPSKEELFNMPKGTKIYTDTKEDNEFVYDGNGFNSLDKFLRKENISDDLKIINIEYPDFPASFGTHIAKIKIPGDYETIYEEETMESLRKLNEELTRQITELKKKLYEKNSQDINISRQEIDIMNDFFERR